MTNDPHDFLTTPEIAELLRIKERKVYELVSTGKIPCTRVTGKLLFQRSEVEAWLAQNGEKSATIDKQRPMVFLGSSDPLLEWALKESACKLASDFGGSMDGIERFAEGEGIAAAIHLYEKESDGWNNQTVATRFINQPVVLMEFCWRERGLVLNQEINGNVNSINDLRGCRIAPRQARAGTQLLLMQLLNQHGIGNEELNFTDVAYTETEAVTSVLLGAADATLGLKGIASQFNLGFIPLMRERFDLLIDRRAWFEPAFQAFLNFCRSPAFKERAESLQGYDVKGFGNIHFNG
jgi:putative molybdopterin biosynthesis protein